MALKGTEAFRCVLGAVFCSAIYGFTGFHCFVRVELKYPFVYCYDCYIAAFASVSPASTKAASVFLMRICLFIHRSFGSRSMEETGRDEL